MGDELLLEQTRRAHNELDAIFDIISDSIHIIRACWPHTPAGTSKFRRR